MRRPHLSQSKIMIFLALTCLVSATLFSCSAASAEDWPIYHHDAAHTGYSTGAAPTTQAQATSLWNYTVDPSHMQSPSVPVAAGGFVYVATAEPYGLACINSATGELVWNLPTEGNADGTPAVAEGRVYVGSANGHVYSLDAANGAQQWSADIGEALDSPANFADNRVFIESHSGTVFCLDPANGNTVWNYSTGAITLQASPAVADGRVYVANNEGAVTCLNAADGAKVWNYTAGDRVGSPSVSGGYVYFGSKDGNAYCLNAADGTKVWNYTTWFNSAGPSHGYTWGNEVSDVAVANGYVYVGSSDFGVFCLNALTGEKAWNITTGAEVYAGPSVASGCVYVGSYDGNLYCLDASTGAENWRYAAGVYAPVNAAGTTGSPAIADGVVYVVGNGVLTAIGSTASVPAFPVVWVALALIAVVIVVVAVAYTVSVRKKK